MDTEVEKLAEDVSGNYWNYRWIKYINGETEQDIYYELHEVYYDTYDKPFMWSRDAEEIYVYNAEEILSLFTKILDASMEKVLTIVDRKIIELNEYIDKKDILQKLMKGKQ